MAYQVHYDVDYEGTTVVDFDTFPEMVLWYRQWQAIIRREMRFYEVKEIPREEFFKKAMEV